MQAFTKARDGATADELGSSSTARVHLGLAAAPETCWTRNDPVVRIDRGGQ